MVEALRETSSGGITSGKLVMVAYWGVWVESTEPREIVKGCWLLAPTFSARLHTYAVHPEALQWWIPRAQANWERMAREELDERDQDWEPLPFNTAHGNQFGPCVFKRACLEYKNDPVLMAQSYVQTKGDT